MHWRTAIGAIAVLLVVGLVVGVLGTVATTTDLLRGSDVTLPAIAALAVVAAGFVAAVLVARPSRDWVANPYW